MPFRPETLCHLLILEQIRCMLYWKAQRCGFNAGLTCGGSSVMASACCAVLPDRVDGAGCVASESTVYGSSANV